GLNSPFYGGYGASGYWASSIYFDGMPNGPADEGKYCMFIHDNEFFSNNLFVGSSASKRRPDNMTIRIERNSFHLAAVPEPTTGHKPFHGISEDLVEGIRTGGNTFEGMQP
ncbi:unnamed protein product, partial [marine sediment metagenome]